MTFLLRWVQVFFNNREIKTRVYCKRQTSDSRLRFLKTNNTYTRMVQNYAASRLMRLRSKALYLGCTLKLQHLFLRQNGRQCNLWLQLQTWHLLKIYVRVILENLFLSRFRGSKTTFLDPASHHGLHLLIPPTFEYLSRSHLVKFSKDHIPPPI